jgi:hypothetical protein
MRKRRFVRLTAIEAPEVVLQTERKLIAESMTDLASRNIDGEAYFDSTQGQIEYLIFCAEEDHRFATLERCGRCSHYIHIKTYACEINDDIPLLCNALDDIGLDLSDRIVQFLIERCDCCVHNKDHECSVGCNQLSESCVRYLEQSSNE